MKFVLLMIMSMVLISCKPNDTDVNSSPSKQSAYIKSAHYFSSAWPKTFWQEFEQADVKGEIAQIKNDGFNTVVLTVPWRGFEIGFENPTTTSNSALYERLKFVIQTIVDQQMKFVLRVGFPHDYTPNTGTSGMQQCVGIYTDPHMQKHWLDYLHKVKNAVNKFQSASAGVLISWEDFWCPHFVFPNLSAEERLEKAQLMKYGEWLKSKNPSLVKVLLGQNDVNYQQIKIPQPNDESYVFYIEFIDQMLDEKVLQPTQSVFDNAALEIRVDKDPVKQDDEFIWVGHDLYLDEPNHRGSYWAPFWGAANQGELLTAEQALKNFKYFLKYITDDGRSINHVIEQFNFTDNTPYFPNNANIEPDQLGEFLISAAPLLKKYSVGAGVWTYRDYVDNAIFNGAFEFGMDGWEPQGEVAVKTINEDRWMTLNSNASISQTFRPGERFMLVSSYEEVTFCLETKQAGNLEIRVNDELLSSWSLDAGENCTQLPAQSLITAEPITFSIKSQNSIQIDGLKLFGFTQHLGLYDADGSEGVNLATYRKLNDLLEMP